MMHDHADPGDKGTNMKLRDLKFYLYNVFLMLCSFWMCAVSVGQEQDRLDDLLTQAVQAPDASDRQEAVRRLGAMRPTTVAAVAAVIEALEDRSEFVRAEGVRTLTSMGPGRRTPSPSWRSGCAANPKPQG